MEELRSSSLRSLPSEIAIPEHINSIPPSHFNKMRRDNRKVCDTIEENNQDEDLMSSRAFIKHPVQNRSMNENNLARLENVPLHKEDHQSQAIKEAAIEFRYIESRHGENENNNLASEDSTINENDDENIQTRIEHYNLTAQVRLGNNQFTMSSQQNPNNSAQNIQAPRNNTVINVNNDPAQNAANVYAQRIEREVEGKFRAAIELSSFMLGSYIIVYLIYLNITSWLTMAAFIWAYSLLQVVEVVKSPVNPLWMNSQRKLKKFFIFDWLSLTVCVLGLVIKSQVSRIYFLKSGSNFISTPFCVLGLLNLLWLALWRPMGLLYRRRRWVAIMKRTIIWTQLLLVCLKNDQFLNADWKLVMIPALVGLVVLMLYQLVILYNIIARIVKNSAPRAFRTITLRQQILGLCWLFLLFSFAEFWFMVFFRFDKLMSQNPDSTTFFKVTFIIALVHAGLFILITLIWKSSLKNLMKGLLYQSPRARFPNRDQRVNYTAKFEPFTPSVKYLALVSATFHQALSEEIKSYTKEDIKQWKKSITEVKRGMYSNKHRSFDKKADAGEEEVLISTSKKERKGDNRSVVYESILEEREEEALEDGGCNKLDFSLDDIVIYKDVKRPRRQNNVKDGENLCYICVQRKCTAIIMGCGHSGICYECAVESWKNGDKCVMCRQPIDHILKIRQLEGLDISKCIQGTKKILEEINDP